MKTENIAARALGHYRLEVVRICGAVDNTVGGRIGVAQHLDRRLPCAVTTECCRRHEHNCHLHAHTPQMRRLLVEEDAGLEAVSGDTVGRRVKLTILLLVQRRLQSTDNLAENLETILVAGGHQAGGQTLTRLVEVANRYVLDSEERRLNFIAGQFQHHIRHPVGNIGAPLHGDIINHLQNLGVHVAEGIVACQRGVRGVWHPAKWRVGGAGGGVCCSPEQCVLVAVVCVVKCKVEG